MPQQWAASISLLPPTRKRAQPLPHQSQHRAGDARRAAPGQGAKLLSCAGGGGLQHRAGTHEELRAGKGLLAAEGWAASRAAKEFMQNIWDASSEDSRFQPLRMCRMFERRGVEMLMESLWGLPMGGEELVGVLLLLSFLL